MSQVRTYEEAVQIMVNWWAEKSFETINNKNNGDDNPILAMLFAMGGMRAAENNTKEKQDLFKKVLTDKLLSIPEDKRGSRYNTMLDVDYHPNEILRESVEASGLDEGCLPIKTFTYIKEDNTVTGRYQYGGDWFTI